jgi:uncharacterized protein (TIGR00255 family)
MIRSMTGFGTGRSAKDGEETDLEIRSVNHKFCEVKVRLPRELAALEIELVRAVKERLPRGAVEVSVRRARTSSAGAPRVDLQLAEEYARAFRELEDRFDLARGVTLSDLLAAEGVVSLDERTVDMESARGAALAALDEALRSLCAMREREGDALARDIGARLDSIETLASRVEVLAPQAVLYYRDRLAERVQELGRGIAIDPARVVQEVALYADRSDVSEEITRLRSHVAQARALMEASEPAGRKLEFLVQEMHREANTIGSKSQNTEISTAVVGLKAEIERMREQVLNVE